MPTDLTPDQRMAVSCAVGRVIRRRHDSIDIEDLYQTGAEAVLRAKVDDEMAPAQRHVYMEMRARGAMLDSVRAAFRGPVVTQFGLRIHSDPEEPTESTVLDYTAEDPGASPERLAAVHEACRCVERMPEPCPTVAAMAAAGADCEEIAAALGVTASRVSQHRAKIRRVLERHL